MEPIIVDVKVTVKMKQNCTDDQNVNSIGVPLPYPYDNAPQRKICINADGNEQLCNQEKQNHIICNTVKLIKNEGKQNILPSYPGLVLAVVGDSDSFVPRPWNTAKFTSGLIDTVNGANKCWIIYRGGEDGVSSYIDKAFEMGVHSTDKDLNTDKKEMPLKNEKFIAIKPVPDNYQEVFKGDIEKGKPLPRWTFLVRPSFDASKDDSEDIQKYKWFNEYSAQLLSLLSTKTTPLLSKKEGDKESTELSMKVPVLLIVVEGDISTIHQVKSVLEEDIPVLLIKGSGKAADFIAEYLQSSDTELLLKRKAPLLFGIYFKKAVFDLLQEIMKQITKYNYLITVYDVDDTKEPKLEDAVVEAIITGWSLQEINNHKQENGQPGESRQDQTITSNVLQEGSKSSEDPSSGNGQAQTNTSNAVKEDSKSSDTTVSNGGKVPSTGLMERYQIALTPGSLSLYFYIAYQYIQEKYTDGKQEQLELLLLEAIVADRVDYVSAMIQNGVKFNPAFLEILYDETMKCPSCEAKDCRKIHSIHYRTCKKTCKKIWCTCTNECSFERRKCQRNKKAKTSHEYSVHDKDYQCTCVRHDRAKRLKSKGKDGKCVDVSKKARYLCQELLNHAKVKKEKRSCKVEPGDSDSSDIYHDLLAWAIFGNKTRLAGVFWTKCSSPLLTAIMASSILKNMADKVESAKDRKLHEELIQHSKLFEDRVLRMQNTLYDECEDDSMLLMQQPDRVWGITVSPMACAYENNMKDVIGHPCIQRRLNRIWYNHNPHDKLKTDATAKAAKLTDFGWNLIFYNGKKNAIEAWLSPLMVFLFHYLFVMAVIVGFSAFILTDLNIIDSYKDIGVYEWLLYGWLVADITEEYLIPLIIRNHYCTGRKHGYWFKFRRAFFNIWNVLTCASYLIIAAAVFVRTINSADFHRMALRLYSLGLFTMYMRFLQCMIIHNYFGPKIIMIGEMLLELMKFVWILIIFMMCTGVLYHANMYPSHFDMWSLKGVQFWRIWKIIALPYWQIYGELSLEQLQGENNANGTCTFVESEWEDNPDIERCVEYDWALLIIAAFYLLVTNLLLVNLIIALFSNQFEQVQVDSDRLWKFWRYSIITKFSTRHPVPFNLLIFIPLKIYRRCTQKEEGKKKVLIKEQELHAVRCLYYQATQKK
ncbi:transient receptor potential cation channel subfamily M member 2-like isoform X2 [Mytilus californianus]|uniref:transient receptor potential cation channel subfamily M member 2-like isoform X2 n=1 Tax=Mytilus californianus TaxID=6549 RepID=UPI0022458323|nr:transient receptor potential cation channel subfamily M member 2-like isoform X2 [Mytilus californianus]